MAIHLSIIELILVSAIVIIIGWVIYLHIKMHRLVRGKNGSSLEDSILSLHGQMENTRSFEIECMHYFTSVEKRLNRSVQAVETIRFNPFKGTGDGGNQSFSVAIISEKGDGVVLSTLSSRDRTSIFSKPLAGFKSEFELTEEESLSIENAKQKIKSK